MAAYTNALGVELRVQSARHRDHGGGRTPTANFVAPVRSGLADEQQLGTHSRGEITCGLDPGMAA
eukprot:COSAG02_NODE_60026_length_272_cov_0.901734_2_plen_64_part_01